MIKIALDSCSNITIKEAEVMGVTLIPLNITFGTETYLDEIEIGKKEFYDRIRTLLTDEIKELSGDIDLTQNRYDRFRNLGVSAVIKE